MPSPANQTSSEAWQLAVHQYLSSLPDAHKAASKIPANAGMCLDMIIQAQGQKKGFIRLMDLLKPLIEPLKRFEGAIDVIMQTHGGVASPIWGPDYHLLGNPAIMPDGFNTRPLAVRMLKIGQKWQEVADRMPAQLP